MVPQWIIEQKRDGHRISEDELRFFLDGFAAGRIPDYQMAALAMAIFFRGMDDDETAALTRVMLQSGETLDTSFIPRSKVDKHSTGGIGDKTSLILAPLAACCGVAVPMISGRGLGITGGTLDKMESIPGYRTDLTAPQFLDIVASCGCSIIGQTATLAPADRKLYALRDVTGTVPSIPLIVASIMSKKLAEGIDGLVLDVKCGSGAFMRTRADAQALAAALCAVGRGMGKRVVAVLTAMDEPLGRTAGNALEVAEAVAALRGEGPSDLMAVTRTLARHMLLVGGAAATEEDADARIEHAVRTGAALATFRDMVGRHGGDVRAIDDTSRLPKSHHMEPVAADREGMVTMADAESIGRAALLLGAGRTRTCDAIDPAAGISGIRKIGERVARGEPLAFLHAASPAALEQARPVVRAAFAVGGQPTRASALILETL